jgi:hypothetical protein
MAEGHDGGSNPAPGWYPDPENPGNRRWWDGIAWSAFSEPLGGGTSISPATGSSVTPVSPSGPAGGPPPGSFPPAAASGPQAGAPTVDPWLWQSILATLFCCLPLGVVGIVFASQSQSAMSVGQYDVARQKARTAKLCTLWSVGLVLGFVVVWLVFAVGIAAVGF